MIYLFKKNKNNEFFKLILIILVLIFSNFFLNGFIILKHSFLDRMTEAYGYCDKHGYGFIEKNKKKYDLIKNSKIINNNNFPYSGWMIDQIRDPIAYKYIIYINSKKIPKGKILEQEYNCYIVLND